MAEISASTGCKHCRHLVNELVQASAGYLKVLNQYELAVLRRDPAVIAKLDTERRYARAKREEMQRILREHVAGHEDRR
jgi:hypothetical protein